MHCKRALLSAIVHRLGRVALGTLYPGHYEKMTEQCRLGDEALQDQERKIFPLSHGRVFAHLLATWNVPVAMRLPFELIVEDYSALAGVPEPVRTKAELVKLATFIGRIAVGRWAPWDLVEIPPAALLKRLRITAVTEIVQRTRRLVERLAEFQSKLTASERAERLPQFSMELGYCDLAGSDVNFVRMMLPPMGIKPVICFEDDLMEAEAPLLVNCIGIEPHRLAAQTQPAPQLVVLSDAEGAERYKNYGRTVVLPSSYSAFRGACWDASCTICDREDPRGSRFEHLAAKDRPGKVPMKTGIA